MLTIIIDNAYLWAIMIPFHVADHTLVPVVDHLFYPHPLIQLPHDNEPILVTGGQPGMLFIPYNHLDTAYTNTKRNS